MSNASDFKAALVLEAADITDSIDKLECLADIDTWYLAKTAIDALSDPSVTSYSIGGRSVTRANIGQLQAQEKIMLDKIKAWIGRGNGGLIDGRGSYNDFYSR